MSKYKAKHDVFLTAPYATLGDGRRVVGPDTARYWAAACGHRVPRPFHLRWLLPKVLGPNIVRWRIVWVLSWLVAAGGMFGWTRTVGFGWEQSLAAVVLLVSLPGVLGPVISIPVQGDLPATALTVVAVWLTEAGFTLWAVGVLLVAASMRELSPLWAAIIATNPVLLVALLAPLVAGVLVRPGPDPLGDRFAHVHDRPVRSALEAHRGGWRNAWVMIAPWGVCLAALYAPSPELWLLLGFAYAQLLVATDTVRLFQHTAGPLMAFTAASVIPVQWIPLALAAHVCFWNPPERV